MEELGPAGMCYLVVLVFLVAAILWAAARILFGDV
jgi:hypothetical protein